MPRTIFALSLFVPWLSGCAMLDNVLMSEIECRGDTAYWVWRGEYDSIQGDQPWIEAYAKSCQRFDIGVDRERYMEGWEVGHAKFLARVDVGM